nr:unnamed protein product [Callosobruchus analis]
MELDVKPTKVEPQPSTSSQITTSRLGQCEVCAYHEAKYTCPRCEVKTCSLKCNKIHKLEVECTGERDRTKYVPMQKFTNFDLSSDYRLLEEISRGLEASKKSFGRKFDNLSGFLYKLQKMCYARKTRIKFLPFKFQRRRQNSTRIKGTEIHWHIDWIFVNADNLKIEDRSVPETEKIGMAVGKHLQQNNNSSDQLSERLQYYRAVGVPGVKLFLKAEQKAGKKFFELDPDDNFTVALARKLIIEYPTIHVVLKDHACSYIVIDSDTEDETIGSDGKVKTGNEVVESIVKSGEEDIYKSLKNLLFISEYSDEEFSDKE